MAESIASIIVSDFCVSIRKHLEPIVFEKFTSQSIKGMATNKNNCKGFNLTSNKNNSFLFCLI